MLTADVEGQQSAQRSRFSRRRPHPGVLNPDHPNLVFSYKNPKLCIRGRQVIVEHHPSLISSRTSDTVSAPGAVGAADLLVWDGVRLESAEGKGGVDKAGVSEAADGFHVLEADELHV